MIRPDKQRRVPRRGLASVVVLVCLVVLTMMSGVIVKQLASRRAQVKAQTSRLQAEFLAEAGLRRARARLATDSKYSGETWTIPAVALGRPERNDESDAVVTIAVEIHKDDAKVREVRVQADYPRDPERRARQTRRATVEIESKPTTNGGANK